MSSRFRRSPRALVVLLTSGVIVASTPGVALANPPHLPGVTADIETLCTPSDPGLRELSGLAVQGDRMYAVGDGGSASAVAELAPDCSVTRWIPTDFLLDAEELGATASGHLVIGDIGDNTHQRSVITLTDLDPATGSSSAVNYHYADGAHDAEAFVVTAAGQTVIITKAITEASGIYVPDGQPAFGITSLRKAGMVQYAPTSTPGGPLPIGSSVLITGAALSVDESVLAVRTYTEVYLYRVMEGDVVAALQTTPTRIPVPNEPQGEAVAFTAAGDLLLASEARGDQLPPIEVIRGATKLVGPMEFPQTSGDVATGAHWQWPAGVVVTVIIGLVALFGIWWHRSR